MYINNSYLNCSARYALYLNFFINTVLVSLHREQIKDVIRLLGRLNALDHVIAVASEHGIKDIKTLLENKWKANQWNTSLAIFGWTTLCKYCEYCTFICVAEGFSFKAHWWTLVIFHLQEQWNCHWFGFEVHSAVLRLL